MNSRHTKPAPASTFLVESYWPDVDEAALRAVMPRIARAARDMGMEGIPVAHIGSLLMSADQVVLSVFAARSSKDVVAVNARAGMRADRVSDLIALGFEHGNRWASVSPVDLATPDIDDSAHEEIP
jgi:hypothetical protein